MNIRNEIVIIDYTLLDFKCKSILKKVIIEDKCSILHKKKSQEKVRCVITLEDHVYIIDDSMC